MKQSFQKIERRHSACPKCGHQSWKTKSKANHEYECRFCASQVVIEGKVRLVKRTVLEKTKSIVDGIFSGTEKKDNLKRRGAIERRVSKRIYNQKVGIKHFGTFSPVHKIS